MSLIETIAPGAQDPGATGAAKPMGFLRYLVSGWAQPEDGFCWSDGPVASLRLVNARAWTRDHVLAVECFAFLGRGGIACQHVRVVVQGLVIATWAVKQHQWHLVIIPRALVESDELIVVLEISDPASPAGLGLSADQRRLGLAVTRISSAPISAQATRLDWLGSDQDLLGRVFARNGFVYRAIRHEAAGFVRTLQQAGVYAELAHRGLIPQTDWLEITHDSYALVARTLVGASPVVPRNYCLSALRDAALVWLSINEYLLDCPLAETCQLIDGHGGNFTLFEGSRPRWVDLGSIAVVQGLLGMAQFIRCIVHPLLLAFHQPARMEDIRRLMRERGDGISTADLAALGAADLGGTLLQDIEVAPVEREVIRGLLARTRACVEALHFEHVSNFWSNYRVPAELEAAWQGSYAANHPDTRFRTIARLAADCKVATFIDVGSNDGIFSLLCAREGKIGIAVDTDDASLNKLHGFLGQHPEIQLSVAREAFSDIVYQADLVLCLALTHHLLLSQGLTMAEVASKLRSMCLRYLITEFMPHGLGGTAHIPGNYPDPLPAGYSLEGFLAALRAEFATVQVIDYVRESAPSRRILVLCEAPRP